MIRYLSGFRLLASVSALAIVGLLATGGCRVEEGAAGVGFSNPYNDDDITYFPPDPTARVSVQAESEPSSVDP